MNRTLYLPRSNPDAPLLVPLVFISKDALQCRLFIGNASREETVASVRVEREADHVAQEELRGDGPEEPPVIGWMAEDRVEAMLDELVSLHALGRDHVSKVSPRRPLRRGAQRLSNDDTDETKGECLSRRRGVRLVTRGSERGRAYRQNTQPRHCGKPLHEDAPIPRATPSWMERRMLPIPIQPKQRPSRSKSCGCG